jgi:two-component system sensor histidine kinase PhoQ
MAARTQSLSARLLMTTTLVLLLGFAATIILLDSLFQRTSENAVRELLEVQIVALIGIAEPDGVGGFEYPQQLPEPRLMSVGSGLYAELVDAGSNRIWRSPSAAGTVFAAGLAPRPGDRLFERRALDEGTEIFVAALGFSWELAPGEIRNYQMFVAEDLQGYNRQLSLFRQRLLGGFAGLAAALLVAIWWAIRFSLAPLRQMAGEIGAIETGDRELLSEIYPPELAGVASNLNVLMRSERQRVNRFRTTLDDLAHSLKTPLAVMRSEIESGGLQPTVIREQTARMQSVVDYQLRRAAATGPRTITSTPIPLAPICHEVAAGLQKIYRESPVRYSIDVADNLSCRLERGDLYELVGNIMDNAWKYSRAKVVCKGRVIREKGFPALLFTVEDDGPGIPEDRLDEVLSRGGRLDERGDVPGHGIGLAIVNEILTLYSARISIRRSALGGALIEMVLPG